MAYFYNSHSGEVNIASQSLNPLTEASFLANEARLHSGAGWHEYASQAAMLAAIKANGWPAPNSGNPGSVVTGTTATAAKNIPGVGNIDDVISFLKQGSIWERGAEIVGGFILLYIGFKALTGMDPVGAAKNTAVKAGKVAVLK